MATEGSSNQTFPTWTFDKACPSMEWTPLSSVSITLTANVTADQTLTDLIVLPVETPSGEDKELELQGLAAQIDSSLVSAALAGVLKEQAKPLAKRGGTSPAVRVVADGKVTKYMLMAVGSLDDTKGAGFALGKAIAATCVSEKKLSTVTVVLPETLATNETVVTDVVTAIYQSLYVDDRFRSKKKPIAEDLTAITIASEGSICDASVVDTGKMLAQGVIMAKDIVNAPHNVLNSESLAETAKRIAADSKDGTITCTILDKTECEKRGMGAYLGVARGSETEPQFIHMTYKPVDGDIKRKVALVGKGLLFDTGGYNIKTQMMEKMKFDCKSNETGAEAENIVRLTISYTDHRWRFCRRVGSRTYYFSALSDRCGSPLHCGGMYNMIVLLVGVLAPSHFALTLFVLCFDRHVRI